jgi:hypothetical protein
MHFTIQRQLRRFAALAATLFLVAAVACGILRAQSAMFSSNYYNVYGQGLYLNNYAELYGLSARSRGYGSNYYAGSNANYQAYNNPANGTYQGGGYIQNYNANAYYNPYRNN